MLFKKGRKICRLTWFGALLYCTSSWPAFGQISTDGSLGASTTLSGPDINITANLGQQHGTNLFHSFDQFNVGTNETATFTGPSSIDNIISRVTGGDISTIDGTLASDIDGANVFLINPAGFIFGANASLDLSGSLHISSGDYLRFADEQQFFTGPDGDITLSVAAPTAFGFLDSAHGAIQIQGSRLNLPSENALSLVGGEINIAEQGLISIEQGTVQLVGIEGSGEMDIALGETNDVMDFADIRIQADINVDGEGGGHIGLQGNNIVLENAELLSRTLGDGVAKDIRLRSTGTVMMDNATFATSTSGAADTGDVVVMAKAIELRNGGRIRSLTTGGGQAGTVHVEAEQLLVNRDNAERLTGILSSAQSESSGNAGDILIESKDIKLLNGGVIRSSTFGEADAGTIRIETEQLLVNRDNAERFTGISSGAQPDSKGDAGKIEIMAKVIKLLNGGVIRSSTFGEGDAGTIRIETEQLLVNRDNATRFTGISSGAKSPSKGNAGDIMVAAKTIELHNGGVIRSTTFSIGKAGAVRIDGERLLVSRDNTKIASDARSDSSGEAGEVVVVARVIELSHEGVITTESQSGGGGQITLQAASLLHLQDSKITSTVADGSGDGGNIQIGTLVKPQVVILDNSDIIARASAGNGGNIDLNAQFIFQTRNSIIDASSTTGIHGQVSINATDADIENSILSIDEDFIDVSQWLPIPCAQRDGNKVSSLIYKVRDGTALSPNTVQTRTVLADEAFSGLKTASSHLAAHKVAMHKKYGVSPSLSALGCAFL